MGFFDMFDSENPKDRKAREQEMANMDELGWDELERKNCNNKEFLKEKFSNYEYSDEE